MICFHHEVGRRPCVYMEIYLYRREKGGNRWRTIREHLCWSILTVWSSCSCRQNPLNIDPVDSICLPEALMLQSHTFMQATLNTHTHTHTHRSFRPTPKIQLVQLNICWLWDVLRSLNIKSVSAGSWIKVRCTIFSLCDYWILCHLCVYSSLSSLTREYLEFGSVHHLLINWLFELSIVACWQKLTRLFSSCSDRSALRNVVTSNTFD